MTTGPRNTPYPIVLHVDATGTPVRLAESSSIYVPSVSALTISATTYLGLEPGGGVPGGFVGNIQVKSGNTTFAGYNALRYDTAFGALLANLVSSTAISAITLRAGTVSATNYLNLPSTNLSSLLDVQYASVSGGQALIYSSSINKWVPGYTIFKDDSDPNNSLGQSGDIYFRYIEDSTNAAYLSSLLDTNINAVSNGQSLIWSSGYWIPSAIPTSQGTITSIPSASPIWNAASAEGYDIQWGTVGGLAPAPLDILGFSIFDIPVKVTNYRASDAGPLLAQYTQLNALSNLDVGNAQQNNLLSYNGTDWVAVSSIRLNSISATNWQGLPSATPIWNANKIQNYNVSIFNPALYDVLGIGADNTIANVPASLAATYFAGLTQLSGLADVFFETPPKINDILTYTSDGLWENVSSVTTNSVSATTYRNLPSALPYWNAASAAGYLLDFVSVLPSVTDLIGFGVGQIQNFPVSSAGPVLSPHISLSSLKDVYNIPPNIADLLAYDGNKWGGTSPITIGTLPYWNASRIQGRAISLNSPSANDVLAYDGSEWKPTSAISVSSIVAVSADISSVKLSKYVEPKSTVNISSSAITLNLNNSQVFEISAISNISSITIQNADSRSDIVQGFTIIFSADGTQRTVTNWSPIKWPGGTGPTLTSTNNKKDILSFMSPDNGTNWYGFIGGQNF